jgi:hypothetical protein
MTRTEGSAKMRITELYLLTKILTAPEYLLPRGTTLESITRGPEKLMPRLRMVCGQVRRMSPTIGMGLTGSQPGRAGMRGRGAAAVSVVMGVVTGVIAGKDTGMKEGTAAVLWIETALLIVGTGKGAAVTVDLNQGKAHGTLVRRAGRGKGGVVVVQGIIRTMREGIQVRTVMARLVLGMKGIEGGMIETGGGIGIWKVKLGEPELANARTELLAIVIGTGILHARDIAHLMFIKTGRGLGIKVEMQTVEASDLEMSIL